MTEYNWKKYQLLFKKDLKAEDIEINLNDELRKTNPIIDQAIIESWMDGNKGRLGVGLLPFYESTVYRLNSFTLNQKLILNIGTTTFKDLQGTNATNWILGKIYGEEFLANGILVQSIVITSDQKYVLGKRNTHVKEGYETLAIFGGSLEKQSERNGKVEGVLLKSSKEIFEMMTEELVEELGISSKEIEELKLIAMFRDWKYYPVLLFLTKLNINSSELKDIYNNLDTDEHIGLVFAEFKDLEKIILENPERLSDLTLSAFDILNSKVISGNRDIQF